jgi:hypothetical protein
LLFIALTKSEMAAMVLKICFIFYIGCNVQLNTLEKCKLSQRLIKE